MLDRHLTQATDARLALRERASKRRALRDLQCSHSAANAIVAPLRRVMNHGCALHPRSFNS